jgi:hypothetical protein
MRMLRLAAISLCHPQAIAPTVQHILDRPVLLRQILATDRYHPYLCLRHLCIRRWNRGRVQRIRAFVHSNAIGHPVTSYPFGKKLLELPAAFERRQRPGSGEDPHVRGWRDGCRTLPPL